MADIMDGTSITKDNNNNGTISCAEMCARNSSNPKCLAQTLEKPNNGKIYNTNCCNTHNITHGSGRTTCYCINPKIDYPGTGTQQFQECDFGQHSNKDSNNRIQNNDNLKKYSTNINTTLRPLKKVAKVESSGGCVIM